MQYAVSMTSTGSPERDRRTRQKRVGDALRHDTRNRLLEAAGVEFAARGYAGTTVTRLAGAAGVSVQTLYLAWGSKRALLRGYMEQVLAGGAASPENAAERFTEEMTPHQRLAELALGGLRGRQPPLRALDRGRVEELPLRPEHVQRNDRDPELLRQGRRQGPRRVRHDRVHG